MEGNYQAMKAQQPMVASPVEGAVSRLGVTINGLAAVADNLESRLSSVLAPETPQPAGVTTGGASLSVPLANSLNEQTDRIQGISDQLASVLARLGL